MLVKPDKGFLPSVNKHRSDNAIVCDWIEASVLFDDGSLSKPEIVDALTDLEIYSDSDFAFEYAESLFNELDSRRKGMTASYPFRRQGNTFEARGTWNNFPEYSFCLLVSLLPHYKSWRDEFGPDYGQQGDLFEAITAFRLEKILPEWDVRRYGWTRDNTNPLSDLLPDIAGLLCERCGDHEYWAGKQANDAGLDVLCVRTFPDQRVGFFSLLVQCASGAEWRGKLRDPNLNKWIKYIDFACKPYKAVSIPYALENVKYRQRVNESQGLLFDRLRLFSQEVEPIEHAIAQEIENWLQPAVNCCPMM